MEGILPPEVSELSELVYINFSDNEIDGNIPLSWQRLTKLGEELLDCQLILFHCIEILLTD